MRTTFAAFGTAFGLSGCFVLGESETAVDMYNPVTHEQALCGEGMHRGSPSKSELEVRDKCVAAYRAKGYRPFTGADAESLKNSK